MDMNILRPYQATEGSPSILGSTVAALAEMVVPLAELLEPAPPLPQGHVWGRCFKWETGAPFGFLVEDGTTEAELEFVCEERSFRLYCDKYWKTRNWLC